MEDAIRKTGMLYQYQQWFGKRWRKVWAVVLPNSVHSVARLELFEYRQGSVQEGHVGKKADSKKVIVLRDCIQIVQRECAHCPKDCTAFLLETADRLFTFAAHQAEVQSWVQELCRLAFPLNQAESRLVEQGSDLHHLLSDHLPADMKENSLYETTACTKDFQVMVLSTEAAVRCNLHGEYILTLTRTCLVLKDRRTKQVIFSWPYCFVRKFGQDLLTFSFEAGRRCESGEGFFEFATSYGELLFTTINDAINNLPNTDRSGSKYKSSKKDKKKDQLVRQNPQETGDKSEYSMVSHPPLPATSRAEKPKLSSMFRSLSIGCFEPSVKSLAKSSNADLPPQPQPQEPLYAMITKPQHPPAELNSGSQGMKDYGLWPDPLGLPEPIPAEMSGRSEAGDPWQESTDGPSAHPALKDCIAEVIYDEPEDYAARAAWKNMASYPSSKESWPSDEAKGSVEELDEFFPPYPLATPSTNIPLNSPAECFLTYDNLNLGKK